MKIRHLATVYDIDRKFLCLLIINIERLHTGTFVSLIDIVTSSLTSLEFDKVSDFDCQTTDEIDSNACDFTLSKPKFVFQETYCTTTCDKLSPLLPLV